MLVSCLHSTLFSWHESEDPQNVQGSAQRWRQDQALRSPHRGVVFGERVTPFVKIVMLTHGLLTRLMKYVSYTHVNRYMTAIDDFHMHIYIQISHAIFQIMHISYAVAVLVLYDDI